jgi:putative transposase
MDDVCTKSRPGDVSQRFLCRRDGSLSSSLRVGNYGGRNTQDCSLQHDRSPTAAWTIQQFREVITGEQPYRFVLHDRDRIYSTELDGTLKSLGVIVLRTPFRVPQANSFCERLVGTIRRECLDFLIPLNERHVRRILKEWVAHYNQGRPHSSLGPGIPDPGEAFATTRNRHRHQLAHDGKVVGRSVLGGLHHEYRLERMAA